MAPFKFFDILQQTEVSKSPKGPPFLVFQHCETFKILIFRFFEFFRKMFKFFFCRQTAPFKFFDFLQQTEDSKCPKGPPSLVFGTVRLFQKSHFSFFRKFFQKNFRIFLLSPSIFLIFCNRLDFQKAERVPPSTSLKT